MSSDIILHAITAFMWLRKSHSPILDDDNRRERRFYGEAEHILDVGKNLMLFVFFHTKRYLWKRENVELTTLG